MQCGPAASSQYGHVSICANVNIVMVQRDELPDLGSRDDFSAWIRDSEIVGRDTVECFQITVHVRLRAVTNLQGIIVILFKRFHLSNFCLMILAHPESRRGSRIIYVDSSDVCAQVWE
jgi:hypothetical protein